MVMDFFLLYGYGLNPQCFVCALGFGGVGKGRKGLWRGKLLFESFKKIGRGFGGFEGLHLSNIKVPQIGGFWGVKHTN